MTTTFESAFKALKATNAAAEVAAAEGARTGNVEVMELADERVAEARSALREAYKRTYMETEKGLLLKADYEALVKLAKDNNRSISEFIKEVTVEDGRVVKARFDELGLRDISALAGLKGLTRLWLKNNQIVDISPLAQLTKLSWLWLGKNQIVEISPLAQLTELTNLGLDHNQIVDISPLAQLIKLDLLWLDNNQIIDISSLAQLANLIDLSLQHNPLLETQEHIILIQELKSRCHMVFPP